MTRDSTPTAPATAVTRTGPGQPLSRAADLIRAEWIKLWSARTTYIALAAAAVATALIPLVVAHADVAYLQAGSPDGRTDVNAVALSFRGLAISQLLVATLGALTVTGEYANGAIRTTFVAVPQRGAVIVAKLAVLCVVVFAFGQAIAFGCFLCSCSPASHQRSRRRGATRSATLCRPRLHKRSPPLVFPRACSPPAPPP